jgi:EmrB/QacA subfamily drug resistance transporter
MPSRPASPGLTLAIVCLATFMLLLDVTVVTVALPDIRADLGAGFSAIQWVLDAYTLMLAALLLPAASLGDLRGRRLVFLGGTALFTTASAGCALAPDPTTLDVARAFQGAGGAAMFATALPLISVAFPGPERAGAIGAFAATIGAAIAVGPLVGGAITSGLSWEWIFLVNVPIGVLVLVLGSRRLPETRDPGGPPIDVAGTVLSTLALLALVYAVVRGNADGWGSAPIVGAFAASAVLLGAFVLVEARTPEPMLPLGLLRVPALAAAVVSVLALATGLFGMFLVLVIWLQAGLDQSPFTVGLQFLPLTVVSFVASAWTGRRLTALLPTPVLLGGGLLLTTTGLALMTLVDGDSPWTTLIPGLALSGLGSGLVNPTAATLSLSAVEPVRAGVASGLVNLARQVGTAIGIAVLGAVFEAHVVGALGDRVGHLAAAGGVASTGPVRDALAPGLATAALVGAVVTAVGLVATLGLLRTPRAA